MGRYQAFLVNLLLSSYFNFFNFVLVSVFFCSFLIYFFLGVGSRISALGRGALTSRIFCRGVLICISQPKFYELSARPPLVAV